MRQRPKISLTMFNLLKGFIMISVVFLHSFMYIDTFIKIAENFPGSIVLSAMMPCLFMISGYWLGKRKLAVGLQNSAKSLLKPYLITGTLIIGIGFVHRALIHELPEWRDQFLIPFVLVSSGEEGRSGALWFVFTLFVAWCIYYVVINAWNEKGQILAACLCGIAGMLLLPLRPPFQLGQSLVAFFYVYAGYLIKKKKILEKEIAPEIYIAMIILWAAGGLFGSLNLAVYQIQNGLLSIPGNLCGGFLLIRLFLRLNVYEGKILDLIRWLGRYSLWILCIHSVEANVFPWKVIWRYFPRDTVSGAALHFILRWVLIIVVCRMMILFQQRFAGKRRAA